jgi:hypothetical protein
MTAIYVPIIRAEVVAYIEIWNKHVIRKQKDSPYIVSSKPIFNYYFSYTHGVSNCGRPVDPEFVKQLQADTAQWGKLFL